MIEFLIILGGIVFVGLVLWLLAALQTGKHKNDESREDYLRRKRECHRKIMDDYNEKIDDYSPVPTYTEMQHAKRIIDAFRVNGADFRDISKKNYK